MINWIIIYGAALLFALFALYAGLSKKDIKQKRSTAK